MSKKVCFIYQNEDYVLDGMRSALGLAVENMYAYAAVTTEIAELDEYNKENLEWIRDMEGEVFSNIQANCDKNDMTPITLEELGKQIREMDIVVPYGTY
ncbi:MAG: hypothetical protein KKD01_11225 [Proteobacteria bacterium]|nr:hypothetical protein [Pseudomonadota bacterium]MBU1137708.1 hypothetical protein [Pseudomonadota bacterium]MBU1233014.1 hypothetical protein [Pseudomonadota bacterium]MBU1419189.1 hypothetical protein [Pseudomonadota bacterium]MBU1455287.1 hypothetical protein [Pseudomonadota bacterium]